MRRRDRLEKDVPLSGRHAQHGRPRARVRLLDGTTYGYAVAFQLGVDPRARPPEPAGLCPRYYPLIRHRSGRALLFRAIAVGVLEDVYDAGSGFEDGRVLCTTWDVVGLTRLVDSLFTADGQVQAAGHDYAPLCAVGVGRNFESLCGPEEDRLAVGAGDHTSFQTLEGRVYLREVLYPARVGVQSGSFPVWRRRLRRRSWRHYTDRSYGFGGAMERLRGKRAIVTGAGSGIGRAIALRLAAEGADVLVSDVDEAAAQAVAREMGGETLVRKTDVTNPDEVEALVKLTVDDWDGLDVMVNNAGVGVAGTSTDTSEEDYEMVMDVCLKGTFFGMRYAIPAISNSGGGSVVNMSSVAALVGIPDRAVYSAAKGAILAITRAAAIDHVEEGVRVNCIAPGTVDTPWIARITSGYDDPEEARANMQARQPHGRFVAPEEIAAMAAYLASDESGSVIGGCMVVDGGVTAR